MKRARSVAIFSLKLKERRAREASAKEAETKAKEKWMMPPNVGGELSCIPIEKLISVDDVAMDLQRRMNPGNL
jgi:anoctamin-8